MQERHWVTAGVYALTIVLLAMAWHDKTLWDVKLFEVILQAVVLTGLINMVLGFHYSASKGMETARENTGKMADAIQAVAKAGGNSDANALNSGDAVVTTTTVTALEKAE
jgi:hypothetical protein